MQKKKNAERAARIAKNANTLATLAHDMTDLPKGSFPGGDPALALMAGLFADDVKRLPRTLKRGSPEYARDMVLATANFCVHCHTRSDVEVNLRGMPVPAEVASLSAFDRAEVSLALRRFDEARSTLRDIVFDAKLAETKPLDWEVAVYRALAFAVRMDKNPDAALELVDRVMRTPGAAELREDAAAWRKSLLEWKSEKPYQGTNAAEHFARGAAMASQAIDLQRVPADHAADVMFLRASGALHEALTGGLPPEKVPEALYFLGVCDETLSDLDIWSSQLLYYEACIRRAPQSEIAEQCFERFEQRSLVEYTGNGGGPLPADVSKHLEELRQLALPKGEEVPSEDHVTMP